MLIAPLTSMIQASAPAVGPALAPWTAVLRTDAQGNRSATASATSADGAARLVVRCDARATKVVSVQFIPAARFIATTDRPVSLSFDGGAPLPWNWEYPGGGAFVRLDGVVTNLVAGIAHARQIRVRALNPVGEWVDATFAGPASDAPIRQVLAACDYQLGVMPNRSPTPAPTATPAR